MKTPREVDPPSAPQVGGGILLSEYFHWLVSNAEDDHIINQNVIYIYTCVYMFCVVFLPQDICDSLDYYACICI